MIANEEARKNDAALRLAMLIWAVQRDELTVDEATTQARDDADIMRYCFKQAIA